jgi:putative oxidoreductase
MAELGCSILLLAGLVTRFALFPLMFTMATAVLYAHGGDPWAKKELAVLYFMIYAALMVTGPGAYSLDHKLWGARSPSNGS